jgi:hypothetical protein
VTTSHLPDGVPGPVTPLSDWADFFVTHADLADEALRDLAAEVGDLGLSEPLASRVASMLEYLRLQVLLVRLGGDRLARLSADRLLPGGAYQQALRSPRLTLVVTGTSGGGRRG